MKLEFDSVSDLQKFLNWAYGFRPHDEPAAANRTRDPIGPAADDDGPLPTIDTSGVAFDTPPAENGTENPDPAPTTPHPTSPEPTKRKRRTKADIEADEKAARDAQTLPTPNTSGPEHVVPSGLAPAALEASAAAQRLGDKPEGTNPFEQAAHTGATTEGATNNDEGSATEPEVVTPFQHLTRAREFIGKHGMPKYNESFAKAGLDPNVMAYTGYQRALHIDALDALEAA